MIKNNVKLGEAACQIQTIPIVNRKMVMKEQFFIVSTLQKVPPVLTTN